MAIRFYATGPGSSSGAYHNTASPFVFKSHSFCGWFKLNKLPTGSDYQYAFNFHGGNSGWIGVGTRAVQDGLALQISNGSISSYYWYPTSHDCHSNWFWIAWSCEDQITTLTYKSWLVSPHGRVLYKNISRGLHDNWNNLPQFWISNWDSGDYDPANADIYNVKIFNGVIEPSMLLKEKDSFQPINKNIYAWWPLDNSTDLRDYSGNNRSLVVQGAISTEQNPVNYHKYSPIYKQQVLPQYSRDVYLATRGRR